MKKKSRIILFSAIILVLLIFASYGFYRHRMGDVLSGVDRIVLRNDGGKDINTEIKVDSEVYKIFRNASYSGSTFVSDTNDYSGVCYFKDGISGTISISKKSGDILIFVSDDYKRHFNFSNGFDRVWLNYIKSKVG